MPESSGRTKTTVVMLLGLLATGTAISPAAARDVPSASCPAPDTLAPDLEPPLADVRYLSDDALGGREVASPGARCAARYLADRFRALGLEPAGDDGGWYQRFEIRGGARLSGGSVLEASGSAYPVGEAWIPYGFAADREVSAALSYGGHGISRPGEEGDPHARAPVRDRLLVVEAGDPGSPEGRSVHADPHFKATVASGRGAAGLLILLSDGAPLPEVADEARRAVGIPVAAVRGPAAQRLRDQARAGGEATLRTSVRPRMVEARNVVALLPGRDPALRDEWIVVGAHYDHLGGGGEGSLAPDETGTVHNGADDNASGAAAILEVARRLREGGGTDRSVLFIAFTGEEKGLWGSGHYAREPLHPLDRTVAMLNLDMVGRLEDDPLTVFGVGTADEWPGIVEAANGALAEPLDLATAPDGFGPSDHASFWGRGVPVLHFFTNTHADYHRPTDDWPKIDAGGLERVSALVAEVARGLGGGDGRQAASLSPGTPESPHGGGVPGESPGEDAPSSTRGYGPYLGTIPDMTPRDEEGVRLTGVREGSPAEEAGIRGGDVVVEFAGRSIGDLYAYTYALRDQAPGDTVAIVVEREGERVPLTAVLGERR